MSVCTPDAWGASAHSQGIDWPSLELDTDHTANQSGACVPAPYLHRAAQSNRNEPLVLSNTAPLFTWQRESRSHKS